MLSSDSSEEEVVTTRVVRRRVIIQVNKHDAAMLCGVVQDYWVTWFYLIFFSAFYGPGLSEQLVLSVFLWLLVSFDSFHQCFMLKCLVLL